MLLFLTIKHIQDAQKKMIPGQPPCAAMTGGTPDLLRIKRLIRTGVNRRSTSCQAALTYGPAELIASSA